MLDDPTRDSAIRDLPRETHACGRLGIHDFRETDPVPTRSRRPRRDSWCSRPRGGPMKIRTAGREHDGCRDWYIMPVRLYDRGSCALPCSLELCSCPYDTKTRFQPPRDCFLQPGLPRFLRNSRRDDSRRRGRGGEGARETRRRSFADNGGTPIIRHRVIRSIQLSLDVLITGSTSDPLVILRT